MPRADGIARVVPVKTGLPTRLPWLAIIFRVSYPRQFPELRYSLQHSNDWSEWELVKEAKPRFEGHRQPYVPVWGYEDEKDPAVMAKKIRAAATHGVDAFIFDWYWYEGGPFLNRCLDEGFLGAPNTDSLKFALMWACHDWSDRFPATAGRKKRRCIPHRSIRPDSKRWGTCWFGTILPGQTIGK